MSTSQKTPDVYRFLVEKAQNGETTTYEAIAKTFGLPDKGSQLGQALSPILGGIWEWCSQRGQPQLTAIVVRKSGADEGMPGRGFWTMFGENFANSLDQEKKKAMTTILQQQVFSYYKM
jgi:hypothetical protein